MFDADLFRSAIEGKCFYRKDWWWTYEFCYKSHVKQYRVDPNSNKIVEEHIIGRYNSSMPFELHHSPDRMDHTNRLDEEGPAWTTSLNTGMVFSFFQLCIPGAW
jgi:hypothetical protein